jgi:hypothetical protein
MAYAAVLARAEYRVTIGSGQPDTGVPGQSSGFSVAAGVILPK